MKAAEKKIWVLKIVQAALEALLKDFLRIIWLALTAYILWNIRDGYAVGSPLRETADLVMMVGLITYLGVAWKVENESKDLKKKMSALESYLDHRLDLIRHTPQRVNVGLMFEESKQYRR